MLLKSPVPYRIGMHFVWYRVKHFTVENWVLNHPPLYILHTLSYPIFSLVHSSHPGFKQGTSSGVVMKVLSRIDMF